MAHRREGGPRRAEAAGSEPAEQKGRDKPRKTLWENTRETCDAILVALVLASIFRTFVMEAFEIPTGSMAPTLFGRHVDVKCPACGYLYSVGADRQSAEGPDLPPRVACPMCGTLRPVMPGPSDLRYAIDAHALKGGSGGDRILVDKGAYTLADPQRWDVGVFVYPHNWQENYIKRVVGLPGDTIRIKGGDIYIDGRIARKPDAVQEVLWFPVFDAAYPPNGSWTAPWPNESDLSEVTQHFREGADRRTVWAPPWEPLDAAGTWDLAGRDFTYTSAPNDRRPALLRFAWKVTDVYAYGQREYRLRRSDPISEVGDVRLRGEVTLAGAGRLLGTIVQDDHRIDYVLSGDPAQPASSIAINGREKWSVTTPLLTPGRAQRFALVNVDQRAWVEVDGRRVPGAVDYADRDYPARGETQPAHAILFGADADARFSRIRIDRDIYYTRTDRPDQAYAVDSNPLTLGEGEYFVLGDHSPSSSDSRRWWEVSGLSPGETSKATVVRNQFVGKALFLYWPHWNRLDRLKVIH